MKKDHGLNHQVPAAAPKEPMQDLPDLQSNAANSQVETDNTIVNPGPAENLGDQGTEEDGQFGDDFDDFEEGDGDLDQDDFGDFDDGFQDPAPLPEDTTVPTSVQPPQPLGVSSSYLGPLVFIYCAGPRVPSVQTVVI